MGKTKFQIWVQENEGIDGKTTLEQQIGLAQLLYNESVGSEKDQPTVVADFVRNLEDTPVKGADSLVVWKGFQVGWFLNVFCKTPYIEKLREYGCELWFIRKVCIVEIIRRSKSKEKQNIVLSGPFLNHLKDVETEWGIEGNSSAKVISEPTAFLSYTGRYTVEFIQDVLGQLDEKEYIWMDIFCVDQFAWTGKGHSTEMQQFRSDFMGQLQHAIKKIGKTALVLEKWDNVMITLEQIWVLWEIFNTAEAEADLAVLLPQAQISDFVAGCLESKQRFRSIQQSLSAIDAHNSKAQDDDDRVLIFERMERAGLSKVNKIVVEKMRAWLIAEGKKCLSEREQQQNYGSADSAEGVSFIFLQQLGRLLQVQGKLQEAEPLVQRALDGQRKHLGETHKDTLEALCTMATLLKHQGKLQEAESTAREAVAGCKQELGDDHENTLISMSTLSMILKDQAKLPGAESTMREALDGFRKQFGKLHRYTLISASTLGMILKDQGKLEDAEPLMRESLDGFTELLGKQHPSTLISLSSLGILLQRQRKHKEAEVLLRDAAALLTQQLGSKHHNALKSISSLGILLKDQDRLDEAEPLLQQAADGFKEVLGCQHSNTVESMKALAGLFQQQGKNQEAAKLIEQLQESTSGQTKDHW